MITRTILVRRRPGEIVDGRDNRVNLSEGFHTTRSMVVLLFASIVAMSNMIAPLEQCKQLLKQLLFVTRLNVDRHDRAFSSPPSYNADLTQSQHNFNPQNSKLHVDVSLISTYTCHHCMRMFQHATDTTLSMQ